jgi:hypothetical protein
MRPIVRWAGPRGVLALAAVMVAAPMSVAADSRLADYRELTRWAYSRPEPLSSAGLRIQLDSASWELRSGTVRMHSPVADGRSHGLVFEGKGRFVLEVPDPIELRQLRRFTEDPKLTRLELEFTRLVVASSDPSVWGALEASGPYEPLSLARTRHEHWLEQELMDVDSQIIEGLGDPEGLFVRADIDTAKWGWLSVVYQQRRREELELHRFDPRFKVIESWVSLDRQEDRLPTGRPSYAYEAAFSVPDVKVTVDVTERAKQSPAGFSEVQPFRAKLKADTEIVSKTDGLEVLRLRLSSGAEVSGVRDALGAPLQFLRDPIGKRTSSLDNDVQDDSVLVLLRAPLNAGEKTRVTFDYEMRLYGFAPGRSWYPGPDGPVSVSFSPHTASFEIQHREDQAIRASGVLEWEGDNSSRWVHERPTKMTSFAAVGRAHETTHHIDGVPEVLTFGSVGGSMTPTRIDQVGSDVSIAADYFQQLFADPLEGPELRSVLIPGSHGQAFDGFLHLSDFTVMVDSIAATTMFRAHEVAHQWWGHRVLWASYRDQWLSEAFAEYSAMMFVEDAVEGGDREFTEILKAYNDEVTGSIKSAFSRYARPDYFPMTRIGLERIGPIGHGYRCRVGPARSSYFTQTYLKGALVLHMLRTLVGQMTRNPATFVEILRSFIDEHGGGFASTDDFIAVLEKRVPADWSWFFDQWVYGAEIPTYQWSYEVAKGSSSPFELRLKVEQKDVPEGFRMAVPVRMTFSGDRTGTALAFVDQPTKTFTFPLPEKPKKVEFNPDYAVLARMKKR